MRVLVTGAGGFLGSHVVETLLANTSCDVVALDSFRHNGAVDRLLAALDADASRVTTLVHDLRVPFSPRQRDLVGSLDVVFDVASRCSVDESIHDPADFIMNNVGVTLTTLELARALKVERYIHVSTDEVFGAASDESLCGHAPSSPYSASKAAQEDVCLAYARTFDVPLTIVTTGNMFGERQSQLAFVPRVVRALLNAQVISVHVYDGVPGSRHYSHARDVADWFVSGALIEPARHVVLPGRYHVDNLRMVELIATALDRPFAIDLVEATSVRPGADKVYPDLIADDGWLEPTTLATQSLEDRLGRTARWFAEHPDWLADA